MMSSAAREPRAQHRNEGERRSAQSARASSRTRARREAARSGKQPQMGALGLRGAPSLMSHSAGWSENVPTPSLPTARASSTWRSGIPARGQECAAATAYGCGLSPVGSLRAAKGHGSGGIAAGSTVVRGCTHQVQDLGSSSGDDVEEFIFSRGARAREKCPEHVQRAHDGRRGLADLCGGAGRGGGGEGGARLARAAALGLRGPDATAWNLPQQGRSELGPCVAHRGWPCCRRGRGRASSRSQSGSAPECLQVGEEVGRRVSCCAESASVQQQGPAGRGRGLAARASAYCWAVLARSIRMRL